MYSALYYHVFCTLLSLSLFLLFTASLPSQSFPFFSFLHTHSPLFITLTLLLGVLKIFIYILFRRKEIFNAMYPLNTMQAFFCDTDDDMMRMAK